MSDDTLAALDDRQLMLRVQQGDTRAFEAVYDRFAGAAYGLARCQADDEAAALDVVEATFLALWRRPEEPVSDSSSVDRWILRTVRALHPPRIG